MTQAKPIPLRKQQKNYTRQRLIQVSRELFVKNGTQATGIDDIARAAGTSRATVYTHFAGKQDIIRELLSEIWDQALIMSESFDALPDISEGSIRGWLVQIFQAWDTYAESTKVVLREMPSDVNAEYQARLEAFHARRGPTPWLPAADAASPQHVVALLRWLVVGPRGAVEHADRHLVRDPAAAQISPAL
jgi:AcrR family transcriptional regulator